MTWHSIVSQLTKGLTGRLHLLCCGLAYSNRHLELCIGCRCQNLVDFLWDKQMSIKRARMRVGGAPPGCLRPGGGMWGGCLLLAT
jgi:hypothetical protein